jgi:hypothetical protein
VPDTNLTRTDSNLGDLGSRKALIYLQQQSIRNWWVLVIYGVLTTHLDVCFGAENWGVGQTSLLLFLLHRVIWKNDLSLDIN